MPQSYFFPDIAVRYPEIGGFKRCRRIYREKNCKDRRVIEVRQSRTLFCHIVRHSLINLFVDRWYTDQSSEDIVQMNKNRTFDDISRCSFCDHGMSEAISSQHRMSEPVSDHRPSIGQRSRGSPAGDFPFTVRFIVGWDITSRKFRKQISGDRMMPQVIR